MKRKTTAIILCVILSSMLFTGCIFRDDNNSNIYTGTVECDDVDVSSEISGVLEDVFVQEGDLVQKGDKIGKINGEELKIKGSQAKAGLEIAKINLSKLQAGTRSEEIKRAKGQVEQLKVILDGKKKNYDYHLDQYEDLKKLYEGSAVSKQSVEGSKSLLDVAHTEVESAKKQVEIAQHELDLLIKGPREEEINIAYKEVEKAMAMVEEVNYKLSKEMILALVDGSIQSLNYDRGEWIPINGKVTNILDRKNLWVKIYVPEKEIHKISLGEEVPIVADYLKDKLLRGKIIFIASEGEFTPKNVESKENKQEMVFGVKIKIIDVEEKLKAGMLVDIDLGGVRQ